jgi:predicted transcriptional regulator
MDFNLFAQRLKSLRKNNNQTLDEVAQATQISKVTLSRYENRKRDPIVKYIKILSEHFGVSFDFLAGLSYSPNEAKDKYLENFEHHIQIWKKTPYIDQLNISIEDEAFNVLCPFFDEIDKVDFNQLLNLFLANLETEIMSGQFNYELSKNALSSASKVISRNLKGNYEYTAYYQIKSFIDELNKAYPLASKDKKKKIEGLATITMKYLKEIEDFTGNKFEDIHFNH